MRQPRHVLPIVLWVAVAVIFAALFVTGILTNITVRSVEKDLPWVCQAAAHSGGFSCIGRQHAAAGAEIERNHFEAQSIKSLIVVPTETGGRLSGFLGFDAVGERQARRSADQARGSKSFFRPARIGTLPRLKLGKSRQPVMSAFFSSTMSHPWRPLEA